MCQGKGTWQGNGGFSSGWMRLSEDNEERERRAFCTSNGETRQTTGEIAKISQGMRQDNFSSGWMRLSDIPDNFSSGWMRVRRQRGAREACFLHVEWRDEADDWQDRPMCQGKGTWQDNFSSGWMRLSEDNEERERRAFCTSNGETRQTTGKIANRARSYRNEANAAPRMVNPPPIRRNGESGICSIKTSQKILAVTWVQIIRAMVKRAPMWIIP